MDRAHPSTLQGLIGPEGPPLLGVCLSPKGGWPQAVLETVGLLLAAYALVFAVNAMPAFMPSTWMILAFFRIRYGLPILALGIGGALVSACGRYVLAKGSELFSRRVTLSKESELLELGGFLNDHRRHTGVAVFFYTLTPLPSNNVFIAAGMVGVELVWVFLGFLGGRLIIDNLLVWTTEQAFDQFGDVLAGTYRSWQALLLQSLSLISLVVLYRLPWARWLRRFGRTTPPA
jgi:hypothetical protein